MISSEKAVVGNDRIGNRGRRDRGEIMADREETTVKGGWRIRSVSWTMLALFLVFALSVPVGAVNKTPLQVIQQGTNRVLAILNVCRQKETVQERRTRRQDLKKVAYQFVDFSEMAKRSLGRQWKKQSHSDRREFVRLFEKLLLNTYLSRVDTFTCGKYKVYYDEQRVEGRYALVRTRISGYKNKEIPIDYRMIRRDGRWWVYDIVIEGVSFVNNYRKQFNTLLLREDFHTLLDHLKKKVAAIEEKSTGASG